MYFRRILVEDHFISRSDRSRALTVAFDLCPHKKAMLMTIDGFFSYQGGVMLDGQIVDGRCQRSATSFFIVGALLAEHDASTQPA
jgi:hypothetical protein